MPEHKRSWSTRAIYIALIALQIAAAVIVFGKWNDTDTKASSSKMIYRGGEDGMTTVVGRSYYKGDDSQYRGKFEMELKVSSMFGGTDFDAHSLTIRFQASGALNMDECTYPTYVAYNASGGCDDPSTTCTIAGGLECRGTSDNSLADQSLPIIYIGGGVCVASAHAAGTGHGGFPDLRDDACSAHGVCLLGGHGVGANDGGCVCELGRYGPHCEGELNNLDKVTYNDGDITAPASIDASTLAASVETTAGGPKYPTQEELDLETHVHVGPYTTNDGSYADYADLNVVTLAGAYLIVSIVLVAYALLGTMYTAEGASYGIPSLVTTLTGSNVINPMFKSLEPIPELVLSGLGAAVVVAAIESFQWQSLAEALPSYVNSTEGAAVSESLGIEEPPMLSFERLMIVITLTIVSRTASYMRSKADVPAEGAEQMGIAVNFNAEFISVVASVVNIIYLLAILDDRTDRMKQLATPIFVAFLTFEIIYLVTVVVTRVSTLARHAHSSVRFIGENMIVAACQSLAVVLALYVSSRRAANLYDTSITTSETLQGTPFMQLGQRNDVCDFIDSDILTAPKDDADAITEEWTGHRSCFLSSPISGNLTYYTKCCTGNSGTSEWFLRGSIWLPLVVCIVALMAVSFDTIRLITQRLSGTNGVNPFFRFAPAFMKTKPDGMPSRYSRIRVQTSLT